MECIVDIKVADIFIYVPSGTDMIHVSKNLDDLTKLRSGNNIIYGVYNMQGTKKLFPIVKLGDKMVASYYVYYHFDAAQITRNTIIFCYDVDSYNYVYDKLLDLVSLSDFKDTMNVIKLYERSVKKDYAWVYLNNVIQKGEIITRVGWIYIFKFKTEKDFVAICDHDVYFDFNEIMDAYRNGKIKRRII